MVYNQCYTLYINAIILNIITLCFFKILTNTNIHIRYHNMKDKKKQVVDLFQLYTFPAKQFLYGRRQTSKTELLYAFPYRLTHIDIKLTRNVMSKKYLLL